MNLAVEWLWLIPALPLLAAGVLTLLPTTAGRAASFVATGSMFLSFVFSGLAWLTTLDQGEFSRTTFDFVWFKTGTAALKIGWVLDPLTAVMLLTVSLVGSLIFLFSVGYLARDERRVTFFAHLSFFAAAMLGLVIANNLLLLFVCWELVGLASWLLIGFWFRKPEAAAAARKAFVVTRIGDMGFFVGMIWLASAAGTLQFFDAGAGCLEETVVQSLGAATILGGLALSTVITLLVLWGAMGKSGQVPLHVWLPDAMEGPTPVSALIHAAAMVAAGVYLLARLFPLLDAVPDSGSLVAVTWVGSLTAFFAALVALGQTDLKRILAWSTISQLGYMMLGLGTGGPAVAMFHLVTHAFFKALLFLGAGSVIQACGHEQDIRRLGGLRRRMPFTFGVYAIGMLALAGFPFLSGFWSKEAIFHSAQVWEVSRIPFVLAVAGALLTAVYMTRQMVYVFFGEHRNSSFQKSFSERAVVTAVPLAALACGAITLGFLGTQAFPLFQEYLEGETAVLAWGDLIGWGSLGLIALSTLLSVGGMALAWGIYRPSQFDPARQQDPLNRWFPRVFRWLENQFFLDEWYRQTVVRGTRLAGWGAEVLDRLIWGPVVRLCAALVQTVAWCSRLADEQLVNRGFDRVCRAVRQGAAWCSERQNGRVQTYIKYVGASLALVVWVLILIDRS